MEQANAVAAQPRGIAWPAQCRLRVAALERPAGETLSAPAARLSERPDDVIADVDVRDVRTDGSHGWKDWNAPPPDDPLSWGVTVYRAGAAKP